MFYEITDRLRELQPSEIDFDYLTAGCVSPEELTKYGKEWGFDEEPIAACQKENTHFRTEVEVHEKYTFSKLKIVDRNGNEDSIAILIQNNFLLIVDIIDEDRSTEDNFTKALHKYPSHRITLEKLLLWFIEGLLMDGIGIAERLRGTLSEMEEAVIRGEESNDFRIELLALKKEILKYGNYYGQLLDIVETLEENENEILNGDRLIYVTNLTNRVSRLREDMNMLISSSEHLQDAYATLLDQRMNNTMKVFTIITTIFFPLTIIVGWYGMNFISMPELYWKYGYFYVIALSVLVLAALVLIGKKKKWF